VHNPLAHYVAFDRLETRRARDDCRIHRKYNIDAVLIATAINFKRLAAFRSETCEKLMAGKRSPVTRYSRNAGERVT
jgi:hypothetical protein